MRFFLSMCVALGLCAGAVQAQDSGREMLGFGRLFSNDRIGDGDDRWRSGSYVGSWVRGPEWQGQAPEAPGALLEYRLRSEIIAPSALNGPGSSDRAYVGALSAGVFTHFIQDGWDVSAGMDIVVVGPQTGVMNMQDGVHDLLSAQSVGANVEANQLANAVYPTAHGSLSYRLPMGEAVQLRPFVETQYGVEDLARFGADVLIGQSLMEDLWLRDPVTGHLYSGVQSDAPGVGFVLGADYARLSDSAYFPASFGTDFEEERFRARAGIHWRIGTQLSYFYGLTYLSEEYVGQSEGQVVGSLKLNFNF